jgi:hypothetical protein
MKIGILTIITGRYDIFFDGLYESLEENFVTDHEKIYYVFTDSDNLRQGDNIIKIHQNKLGWPHDTMMRFHHFDKIREMLMENDYIFFFNANMKALNPIGNEVFPTEENNYLMGAHHPGYFGKPNILFPYERNDKSNFSIPIGEGTFYNQGCFNGGRSKEFLDMSKELAQRIDEDLVNGIIPKWHDESAINWYYKDRNPLLLGINYIHQETIPPIDNIKMVQQDKKKFGTFEYLRG